MSEAEDFLALPRCQSTPAGIRIGPLDEIPDGRARGFVLRIANTRFHGFAVRRGDAVHGYVDRCPHAGLPLAQWLDGYLTEGRDHIACAWHGALFAVEDGRCVGGPCVGQSLLRWPLDVDAGMIVTA